MEIAFENNGAEHLRALLEQPGSTETPAGVRVTVDGFPGVRRLLNSAQEGRWVLGVKFQNGEESDGVVDAAVDAIGLDSFLLQPVDEDGAAVGFRTSATLTAIERLWVF